MLSSINLSFNKISLLLGSIWHYQVISFLNIIRRMNVRFISRPENTNTHLNVSFNSTSCILWINDCNPLMEDIMIFASFINKLDINRKLSEHRVARKCVIIKEFDINLCHFQIDDLYIFKMEK